MGINMASGKKYDRLEEGIEEAIRLMRHCRSKGVTVRYYYLGNEPYHKTANYIYTAEEYAEMIHRYAEAMRKVDPDIRIIANTHPRNLDHKNKLTRQEGTHIQYIEIRSEERHIG